ncbi:MAG: VIT1/CCC1 transporter family protein [Microthrixaceae bacterium]
MEQSELERDPEAEIQELTVHWQTRGLEPELARVVAERLTAHDALSAQLEAEYGFDEPMPAAVPLLSGLATCVAFVAGALIPLLITYFAPVNIETWAILGAVVVALAITSVVSARAAHLSTARTLGRSLTVGGLTLLVSYVAGELLLG